MDIQQTILLGIMQGLTEFLPISSSGHLIILQHLIGLQNPEVLLDVSLHVGTLVAIVIFFHDDIKKMIYEGLKFIINVLNKKMTVREIQQAPHAALALFILLGTIPTGVIGLIIDSFFYTMFGSTLLVGFMLILTGTILLASYFITSHETKKRKIGIVSSLSIGLAQGAAIIPGISRSGATIVCGLFCGLTRETAGKFSFMLSIPAILGASFLEFSPEKIARIGMLPFLTGMLVSFVVGLMALKITMTLVRKGNLYYFAPYCFLIGILILIIG